MIRRGANIEVPVGGNFAPRSSNALEIAPCLLDPEPGREPAMGCIVDCHGGRRRRPHR